VVYLPPAFTERRPEVLLEHTERYEFRPACHARPRRARSEPHPIPYRARPRHRLNIAVTRLEGKYKLSQNRYKLSQNRYKLSQNRPAADRPGGVAALEAQSDPEIHALVRLMRDRETV
jgi:predicted FMN-binding regulatory protein PaiB